MSRSMSDEAHTERPARDQARLLALALDAIEHRLACLGPGDEPDAIAAALAGPVRAFDLAAKEA